MSDLKTITPPDTLTESDHNLYTSLLEISHNTLQPRYSCNNCQGISSLFPSSNPSRWDSSADPVKVRPARSINAGTLHSLTGALPLCPNRHKNSQVNGLAAIQLPHKSMRSLKPHRLYSPLRCVGEALCRREGK